MVDATSGCWFQMVATNRSVDERSDLPAVDVSCSNCFISTSRADVAGDGAAVPKSPFPDPGNQFQSTYREFEPLVEWGKLGLDLCRGHDLFGQCITERLKADGVISHGGQGGNQGRKQESPILRQKPPDA